MKQIGGYHMGLEAAVCIAESLQIDIGEPTEFNKQHMEWPINDWLSDHGMLHVKAAFLEWPRGEGRRPGMFFLTKSRQVPYAQPVDDLAEEPNDVKVKDWLKQNGAGDVEWLSLLDCYNITLLGAEPKRTGTKFKQYATEEEFAKAMGLHLPDGL
ncbi:hypothetical protein DXG03_002755 [Asterophora parasitica]|uniref:Uncharacterized protein n=1 Tax=Asterophora parasitica TaxID=117018 RepID=A0A9P7G2V5_9AGAR|nr:hypothetical protein DXG03_002755 [Asterophora parasitica]